MKIPMQLESFLLLKSIINMKKKKQKQRNKLGKTKQTKKRTQNGITRPSLHEILCTPPLNLAATYSLLL